MKKVSNLQELESALSSQREINIVLNNNITVSRVLWVRGRKTINGNGKYQLIRRTGSSSYKGTLLYVTRGTLELRQVTVNGGGRNKDMTDAVNGKLVEVGAGTVILGSGAKLRSNYNMTSLTDGGGGITVHVGGKTVMKSGSEICDNLTVTGGSGVRVEAGGGFVMEGGTIRNNAVVGQRTEEDFDGRGGAIHNRGSVWIQDGIIYGNQARGYQKENQICGGFGGGIYNQNTLRISGGLIRNNQAAFAGGAIYTNAQGRVLMEGGELAENSAKGQRGGGIYLSAASQVTIQGGTIQRNEAGHGTQIFISSTATGVLRITGGRISGTGAAVWNNGAAVQISGGRIQSTGCGLRTMGTSEIRGGVVLGTQYGVYYGGGRLCLSGNFQIDRIYMAGECKFTVDRPIHAGRKCEICPELYREGKQIATISSGEKEEQVLGFFSLKKRKRFLLETGTKGLYIGRERYKIKFTANGGTGKMAEQTVYVDEKTALSACGFERDGYGFVGWSLIPLEKVTKADIRFRNRQVVYQLGNHGSVVTLYALWVKRPAFTGQEGKLSFYEDEYVKAKHLRYGMAARDESDGEITDRIVVEKVILPDQSERDMLEELPTGEENIGEGIICFRVTNSFGVSAMCRRNYEVFPNHPPEIMAADRYFFVSEYQNSQRQEAQEEILEGLRFRDDVESEEQLRKNLEVFWGELDFEQPGEYPVSFRVTDQYGNRFYMESGTEKQYGRGKQMTETITIYVMERENGEGVQKKEEYVRFIGPEFLNTLSPDSVWRGEMFSSILASSFSKTESQYEETWVITGSDKKKIKDYINNQKNPFSRETNDLFTERFSYLKREKIEGGVGK